MYLNFNFVLILINPKTHRQTTPPLSTLTLLTPPLPRGAGGDLRLLEDEIRADLDVLDGMS